MDDYTVLAIPKIQDQLHHVSNAIMTGIHDVVDPGFLGFPTQYNHPYIPPACNWMITLKYLSLLVLQSLNSLPSTPQTYVLPIIPLESRCIVPPHLVLFPTLYKNEEGIQYNPSEAMLEPIVLLACLDYVVRHEKNSILPVLYNLASKNHPWYPILLEKYLHRLVLQWMHGSSEIGNVLFGKLRFPEPSFICFHSMKEHTHLELISMKMTSPVLIRMLLTCGGFPQLAKPSFLSGNHLWKF